MNGYGDAADHGVLEGLADDDHTQYLNTARHSAINHDGLVIDHDGLENVTSDQHHAKSHTHNADGSGSVAHTALTSVGTDDHHAKSHVHSGDGSGTVDHGSLSGLSDDDHTQYMRASITPNSAPGRALDTTFTPSATRPVHVNYSLQIDLDAVTAQVATVELRCDTASPPTTVICSMGFSRPAGITGVSRHRSTLTHLVPAGHNVRLVSASSGSAPTFTLVHQTETPL